VLEIEGVARVRYSIDLGVVLEFERIDKAVFGGGASDTTKVV